MVHQHAEHELRPRQYDTMTSQELEALALRAVAITNAGETFEDDRVELKSLWPEPITDMARQLAAQANASGRQEFVWLIGVRQKGGGRGGDTHPRRPRGRRLW